MSAESPSTRTECEFSGKCSFLRLVETKRIHSSFVRTRCCGIVAHPRSVRVHDEWNRNQDRGVKRGRLGKLQMMRVSSKTNWSTMGGGVQSSRYPNSPALDKSHRPGRTFPTASDASLVPPPNIDLPRMKSPMVPNRLLALCILLTVANTGRAANIDFERDIRLYSQNTATNATAWIATPAKLDYDWISEVRLRRHFRQEHCDRTWNLAQSESLESDLLYRPIGSDATSITKKDID